MSGDQQFLGSAPVPWTSRLRARSGVGVGAVASPHMATLSSSLAPSRTCHVVRRRHHGKSSPGMAGAQPCYPPGGSGMIARCMRPAQHSRTPQAGIALLVLELTGQRRGSPARAAARRSGDQAHCGSSTSSAAQPGVVLLSCDAVGGRTCEHACPSSRYRDCLVVVAAAKVLVKERGLGLGVECKSRVQGAGCWVQGAGFDVRAVGRVVCSV